MVGFFKDVLLPFVEQGLLQVSNSLFLFEKNGH
jgi:hypothetical protein